MVSEAGAYSSSLTRGFCSRVARGLGPSATSRDSRSWTRSAAAAPVISPTEAVTKCIYQHLPDTLPLS